MCTPSAPVDHDLEDAPSRVAVGPAPAVRSIRIDPDIHRELQHESPFQVRSCRIAHDVLAIQVIGDLDLFTAPLLDTALALRLDPADTPTYVEVDLHALAFLDTAGLDALSAVVTDLGAAGAQVTLVGARRQVRRLLAFAAEHCWLTAGPILAAGSPA